MKFGVREICDVVLKAKATQKVGNKIFYKGEPVIYFDTLKTSSMEGAATTVYAQGGRGNSRLMAWEGERTITFTMEDALISPAGFMILSGAGLTEGAEGAPIYVHVAETTDDFIKAGEDPEKGLGNVYIIVDQEVSTATGSGIYVMPMIGGEIVSEPFYAEKVEDGATISGITANEQEQINKALSEGKLIRLSAGNHTPEYSRNYTATDLSEVFGKGIDSIMVDYYTEKTSGSQQIDITPDKFGGNYYLEASTLFRDTNGVDMPAEFIIPNCKIQSNFTFTMASSGDPSTFTFTMDAFPDYTRFNPTKKVLAAIQIVGATDIEDEIKRADTNSRDKVNENGTVELIPSGVKA